MVEAVASAAAVGSLMILSTLSPAMAPASLVACRWASLKWAGTVMTARETFSPRKASASDLSCSSTIAEICSGANSRLPPGHTDELRLITGLPSAPSPTL